jgi:hypothetical protein
MNRYTILSTGSSIVGQDFTKRDLICADHLTTDGTDIDPTNHPTIWSQPHNTRSTVQCPLISSPRPSRSAAGITLTSLLWLRPAVPYTHGGAIDGDKPIPTRTQELPSRLCYALRRPKRTPCDQTLTGDEVRAAQPQWSVDHGTISATTRRLARPSRRFRQVSGRATSVRHCEANRPNPWLRTATTMDFAHGGTPSQRPFSLALVSLPLCAPLFGDNGHRFIPRLRPSLSRGEQRGSRPGSLEIESRTPLAKPAISTRTLFQDALCPRGRSAWPCGSRWGGLSPAARVSGGGRESEMRAAPVRTTWASRSHSTRARLFRWEGKRWRAGPTWKCLKRKKRKVRRVGWRWRGRLFSPSASNRLLSLFFQHEIHITFISSVYYFGCVVKSKVYYVVHIPLFWLKSFFNVYSLLRPILTNVILL